MKVMKIMKASLVFKSLFMSFTSFMASCSAVVVVGCSLLVVTCRVGSSAASATTATAALAIGAGRGGRMSVAVFLSVSVALRVSVRRSVGLSRGLSVPVLPAVPLAASMAVRSRRIGGANRFPRLRERRIVAVHFQPGYGIGETRAMGKSAGYARWQLWIEQSRERL